MKTGLALSVSLAILCLPCLSAGNDRSIVAVFGIHDEGKTLDEELLHSLTEYLAASVAECRAYRIVLPWVLQQAVNQKAGGECFDPECQDKIGRGFGADLSVSTSILRVADKCTVVSALHDLNQQTHLISARARGDCNELGLVRAIDDLAYFFLLWGGCKPPSVETPEGTESLYEEAAEVGATQPVFIQHQERLPALEDVDGEEVGSVPDMMVSAGWIVMDRELGQPRHQSGISHGVRIDARFFLESVIDVPVLEDVGFAMMYSAIAGFDYVVDNYGDDTSGLISQWQVEALYRLEFNQVKIQPAFLFRLGYGGTSCTIDSRSPVTKDAGYGYPYLAMDSYFMLYRPYLRTYFSAAFLFHVDPSEDLEGGPYLGVKMATGLDIIPVEHVYLGLGYELTRFLSVTVNEENSTDTLLAFFLRLGCTFH